MGLSYETHRDKGRDVTVRAFPILFDGDTTRADEEGRKPEPISHPTLRKDLFDYVHGFSFLCGLPLSIAGSKGLSSDLPKNIYVSRHIHFKAAASSADATPYVEDQPIWPELHSYRQRFPFRDMLVVVSSVEVTPGTAPSIRGFPGHSVAAGESASVVLHATSFCSG